MAWSFGREVGKTSAGTTTSTALTLSAGGSVPLGNLVVVWSGNNGAAYDTPGISDSAGNTWHQVVNLSQGGLVGLGMWWTVLSNAWTNASTVTVTSVSGGATVGKIYCADFTPPVGTIAQDGSNSHGAGTIAAWTSNAINTTGALDLVVGGYMQDNAAATSGAVAPVNTATPTASITSSGEPMFMVYGLDQAPGSYSANGTAPATATYAAGVIGFSATLPPDPGNVIPARDFPPSTFGPF